MIYNRLDSILQFKYSFLALFAIIFATSINILYIFNLTIISVLSILCIVFNIFLFIFKYEKKSILVFCVFFIIGLISSAIYNNSSRVFSLDTSLNEHKVWIKGQISSIDKKSKYAKITIKNPTIYSEYFDSLEYNKVSYALLSTFSSRITDSKIGDDITTRIMIKLPREKSFKDDFDYGKYLLAKKINLTGQIWGEIYITKPLKNYTLWQKILNLRLDIQNKIVSLSTNDQVSGISLALLTGLKGNITPESKLSLQKSGLAHLMAISGMHMAFVCGFIFLFVRLLASSIPIISLNYSSKSIAGVLSLFVGVLYLVLSGANLPALRAFSMVSFFIVTILLNKQKIAIHTLCSIAIIILMIDPNAVFSASFQLSFSAVLGILIYNQVKDIDSIRVDYSFGSRILKTFVNSIDISIIAFCATLFFVATYFHYISLFGIAANIIASLLVALVIMPALFLYAIFYVGFDIEIFNTLNNYSISSLLNLSNYFAGLNNSHVYVSQSYSVFLLLISLLIIFIISFDYKRKYLISLALLFIGFIIPIKYNQKPEFIQVSENSIILIDGDNYSTLGSVNKSKERSIRKLYNISYKENTLDSSCDVSGCVYYYKNKKILIVNDGFTTYNEDVLLNDYIVYK